MFWSIETPYNGTMYRSRTEARYALMFECADIDFQYEPDGYEFEERGRKYIPDFWVPSWNSFLEVKPDSFRLIPGDWSDERCKCEVLNEATNRDVLLAAGSPSLSLRLNLFQADRIGWRDVYLATYVPGHAILAAKQHRFDWRKTPRERPRRGFNGEGSIGGIANSILGNMLVRKKP
jgi:hypothetical protein